jgi:hypothetical protein
MLLARCRAATLLACGSAFAPVQCGGLTVCVLPMSWHLDCGRREGLLPVWMEVLGAGDGRSCMQRELMHAGGWETGGASLYMRFRTCGTSCCR